MKIRLWHKISAAFLFGSLSFGPVSCSSQEQQQQAQDQVVENEEEENQEGQDQQGYEGNSDQQDAEGYQGNEENGNAEEGYAENQGQEGGQQQDELQEIIDGMNQQQAGEGEATNSQYAEGESMDSQYADGDINAQAGAGANGEMQAYSAGEGESLNTPEEPMAEAQASPMEDQMAAAGMAAAPGLAELGSKMSYVVGTGDTLASIAMKIYGDMGKWREIAEFTGMANPNRIYPGDVVYYQLTDQTMAFASAYESLARSEIVVQPGDTLSTISSNVLGRSIDWKMIWRQNDNIDNPDVLTVGQTLYYINPGNLSAAISGIKEEIVAAKTKVEVQIQVVEATVETVTTEGGELVNSISHELQNDFAALTNAGFSRVI